MKDCIYLKILGVILCSSFLFYSCNNETMNKVIRTDDKKQDENNLTTEIDSIPQFPPEEVLKVYKNVKFGDTRKNYKEKLPKKINLIGKYKFEFIPGFDHEGKLYTLEMRGLESSKNTGESMKFLNDMMVTRYGTATYIASMPWDFVEKNGKIDTIINSFEVKSSVWNIGDKSISIFGRPLPVSIDERVKIISMGLSWEVYPIMKITHLRMRENYVLYMDNLDKSLLKKTGSNF
jgi:hypothetical protein